MMKPAGNVIYDALSKRLLHNLQLGCKLRQGSSALEELLLQILLPCPCCVSEVSCPLLLLEVEASADCGLFSLIKFNSGDYIFLNVYPSEFISPNIRKSETFNMYVTD